MSLLPSPEEQAWLLDELATLIRRRGHSTFVATPVLEPTMAHFPEPGAAEIARRLCTYAQLGQLRVDVPAVAGEGAQVLGAVALAVARAYRRQHELAGDDAALEARRTEVTAVYLGFGVLLAEAGALSPRALAFLQAAQLVTRAPTAAELAHLAGQLGPARGPSFEAAHAALAPTDLVWRLRLPRSITWPAPRPAVALPLADEADARDPSRGRNDGKAVFRVRQDFVRRYTTAGVVVGIAFGFLMLESGLVGATGWVVVIVAAAALGWWQGGRRGFDRCSEPECGWTMPPRSKRCFGCGGAISGRISHEDQRLAARAALTRRDFAGR